MNKKLPVTNLCISYAIEVQGPYTKYSLKVLENIKGELKDDVEIFKAGGLSSDKESLKSQIVRDRVRYESKLNKE